MACTCCLALGLFLGWALTRLFTPSTADCKVCESAIARAEQAERTESNQRVEMNKLRWKLVRIEEALDDVEINSEPD